MKLKTLEQILKNKSSKVEFAIVTNLQNGESEVFEPGKKLSGCNSSRILTSMLHQK